MSRANIRRTASFDAVAADGTEYTIEVWTRFIEVRTRAGSSEHASMQYLRTLDGGSVNRLEKGKYEIVGLGVLLISDDPEAI